MLVRGRQKRARQVKSKFKSMPINFFGIKGIAHKDSSSQAKQSILHATLTFYGNCVKMCEDFAPNFGDKRTGCCITIAHRPQFLFHQAIYDREQHNFRPPNTPYSLRLVP
jgi:hypothetical protein